MKGLEEDEFLSCQTVQTQMRAHAARLEKRVSGQTKKRKRKTDLRNGSVGSDQTAANHRSLFPQKHSN